MEEIDTLHAQADRLQEQVKLLLPRLAEARRRYAVTKTATDRTQFESIREEASMLEAKLDAIVDAMIAATGLSSELFRTIDELDAETDLSHLPRRSLTEDRIASTADLDSLLPKPWTRFVGFYLLAGSRKSQRNSVVWIISPNPTASFFSLRVCDRRVNFPRCIASGKRSG